MGEAQASSFIERGHSGNSFHSCSHRRCDPTCPGAARGKGFFSPHQIPVWSGGISQLEEAVDGDPGSGSSGESHRKSLCLQPLCAHFMHLLFSQFTFLLPVQRLCLISDMPRALSGTDLAAGAASSWGGQHSLPPPATASPCPHGGCALAVPTLCQGTLELSKNGASTPGNISQLRSQEQMYPNSSWSRCQELGCPSLSHTCKCLCGDPWGSS